MTNTPPPQTATRSRGALSLARTLLVRLLIRATIAAVLVSLVAWICVLRAYISIGYGNFLIKGTHESGSFHYSLQGMIYRDFGAAGVQAYFDDQVFRRDHTIPSQQARRFRHDLGAELMNHSTRWIILEPPTPPDSLKLSHISTYACGYPFMAYRAVSIEHEVKFHAPLTFTRDMWQDPLPRTASIGPALPIQPSSQGLYASINQGWSRPAPLIHLNWGHFPTNALPAFLRSAFAHNPNLPSHIPIAPYWPGLLANIAIYTAIIWFMCWLFTTTRRAIHRRRHPNANPCKRCRYDLTGITQPVCPECGQHIQQAIADAIAEPDTTPSQSVQ